MDVGAAGALKPAIGFREFVGLMAALMATQAIAIDAMLPALPQIVRTLGIGDENLGQWVIATYFMGLASGQLFWGTLSDRYGRRPILLIGLFLYVIAGVVCSLSGSFASLLFWRGVHGLAASSIVVVRSVIRDRYDGRHMARVMSLCFMVFLMVPVLAPSLGQLVLLIAPWRQIFLCFGIFGAIVTAWTAIRLPETLPAQFRSSLSPAHLLSATRLVLGTRLSLGYTLAQLTLFGTLLSYLGMVQQIFNVVFLRPALMPAMFALSAVASGLASYFNARFVERLGMRTISHAALLAFVAISGIHVLVALSHREPLWLFVLLQSALLASFCLAIANFMSMAMEPLGAVAGIGAALQGFVSQLLAAFLGALIGRYFDGTLVPLAMGSLVCGLASLACVLAAERWRLFRHQHADDHQMAGAAAVVGLDGPGAH